MKKTIVFIAVLFIAIQFIKIDTIAEIKSAPQNEIEAPKNIKMILQTSCYDCHSNHSTIPWYGDIAPASWFVRSHINDGREVLNFSQFNSYDKTKQKKLYGDIAKSIVIRMPLGSYTLLHSDAKLSKEQKELLKSWAIDNKNKIQ